MSVLSERVKKLRSAKRQSQNEVGKALGKSRETVSKYELGEREPDPEAIVLFAKHFNVSADYLLGINEQTENLATDERKPYSPELYSFEKYLKNEKFIPYLQLAVSMMDSNIEIKQFEKLINKIINKTKINLI
ncbi:helix-turn-helix domain-containing protein [Ruminiclostridium papyrosolvens]|uniref:XRE family transcriptional regulator n=1 Tax=Ruminiclostridium papyrosolvens C7 TaxID=1330534 RepID=U4QZC1_9FIRM|nr:helix-turn-helix transcriptional regulator [Ruminiclostridium papyrosolvens]EPR10332.1 XRE family transcriptional regulator [Ruminiclostridium papyrosolvens C7]